MIFYSTSLIYTASSIVERLLLASNCSLPKGDFLWIGTQGYEMAKKNGLHVMNEKTSSEQIDLDFFIDDTNEYLKGSHYPFKYVS